MPLQTLKNANTDVVLHVTKGRKRIILEKSCNKTPFNAWILM